MTTNRPELVRQPVSGRDSRPPRWRLAVFASGDFGFNLFWQSLMLYQLFYYTETLRIPMAEAATCYAIASVWDGLASFAVGILTDRRGDERFYRRALIFGAAPLGLSFVLTYSPPPAGGHWIILAWILGGQILARTAYAFVNIPYLAMSARVSTDNADRALIAAGRMLAGTLAAVVVALGTLPLGQQLSGSEGPGAYAGAALLFALVGVPLLVGVGLTYRDGAIPVSTERGSVGRAMILAWRNRAFVTLALAMVAMVAAVTMLDKSVLYYFKYVLVDPSGGQLTLGAMMAVGGLAVPVWLVISRATGVRAVWFIAVTACLAGLAMFVFGDVRRAGAVQTFLVVVQAAVVGLHFSVWALLPGAVDYGHRASGVRVEAVLYGYTALLQRLAIGLGTALLGLSLGGNGAHLPAADDAAYRLAIAGLPLALFGFAGLAMLFSPQRGEGKAQDAPRAVPMPAD